MTDRKPPGVGFGTWVEHKIREAAERGAFDNLPGAGKPIPDLDQPHDELWWIRRKLRDEGLAWLPPTIALRKEAEAALAAAARAGSEAEVRAIVAGINAKIADGNRKAASGLRRKLRDEGLAWLPPTIALRKEAEAALAAAARAGSEAEVRAIVAGINAKIVEGNRKAASGPPLNLAPFDPERVVACWHAAREG